MCVCVCVCVCVCARARVCVRVCVYNSYVIIKLIKIIMILKVKIL